jgi:hypothetical protein
MVGHGHPVQFISSNAMVRATAAAAAEMTGEELTLGELGPSVKRAVTNCGVGSGSATLL